MTQTSQGRIKIIFCLVALFVLLLMLLFKIKKYSLFYYQDDLYSVLQSTKSWFYGYSFLWDNRYGHLEKIHFSYSALLLAPFTLIAGAKGLFIVHGLALFLVFVWLIFSKLLLISLQQRIFIGITFLISPYSFYIFDNPVYGWHLEMMFLPFAFLFTMALLQQNNKWMILLSGLLLCATKEDGAVIACCIHLAYLIAKADFKKTKQVLKTCLLWGGVFILILFFLKAANHFAPMRLENAVQNFLSGNINEQTNYFLKIISNSFLLLLPLFIFLGISLGVKKTLLLLLLCLPVVIVCTVSGIYYYPSTNYSISWAPRWVEVMAVVFCGGILFLHFTKSAAEAYLKSAKNFLTALVFILCFVLQQYALGKTQNYFLLKEISAVAKSKTPHGIGKRQASLVRCIAKQIPKSNSVIVPNHFFNLFEHCNCFAADYLQNAPAYPQLVILKDSAEFETCKLDYSRYAIEKKVNLYFLTLKGSGINGNECE